jgi:DMSO reductase anchor subunit
VKTKQRWNGKPPGATTWDGSVTEAGTEMRSYYGRPVIKEPVWEPEVPMYFFTGGLGGATAVLGLLARLGGREQHARRLLFVEAAAETISPLLLTADLGRPERFLNMLRVFKPSSPMSVGSWVLVFSSLSSAGAAALELLDRAPRAKLASEAVSAALGPVMATYTAVLIANTAVPAWHDARHELPLLFAAGSAASAGAVGVLVGPLEESGASRRLAIGGSIASIVVEQVMTKRMGKTGEPYHQGRSGWMMRGAKLLNAAGAALLASLGKRRPAVAVGGAALVTAGELLLRFGVFHAGDQSARDPGYTVEPQRERVRREGSRAST